VRTVIHSSRPHFFPGVLSYRLLALILIIGTLPPLLTVIVRPTSEGPAISLDICHPAQALDTFAALIPLVVSIRIAYRDPMAAFGAPGPFLLDRVKGYIPDIIRKSEKMM
jgi:hypothetical protein